VQVVWRAAGLQVQTLDLPEGDSATRLAEHAQQWHFRMDVRQAPLMHGLAAFDGRNQRWLLLLLQHHLAMDHVAVDLILEEIGMVQSGRTQELPVSVPFLSRSSLTHATFLPSGETAACVKPLAALSE